MKPQAEVRGITIRWEFTYACLLLSSYFGFVQNSKLAAILATILIAISFIFSAVLAVGQIVITIAIMTSNKIPAHKFSPTKFSKYAIFRYVAESGIILLLVLTGNIILGTLYTISILLGLGVILVSKQLTKYCNTE